MISNDIDKYILDKQPPALIKELALSIIAVTEEQYGSEVSQRAMQNVQMLQIQQVLNHTQEGYIYTS